MKYRGCYLILLLLLGSCSAALSEKEKLKKLEEQVLNQHDEAMGKMDKIIKLKGKLNTYLKISDSLQTDNNIIRKQIADLISADAAMMNWMYQYRSPNSLSTEKAWTYLQDQLVKIEHVKKQMDSALISAVKTKEQYDKPAKK